MTAARMGMRIEIDIEDLAAGVARNLAPLLGSEKSVGLPALLNRSDAANYLGVSVRTFDGFAIPRVVLTNRCFRYRREDLDRYAAERLRH